MNYETIFQTAREIVSQRLRSGEPVMPDDTVCVIASVTGKLYTAQNRRENVNGTIRNIHAEKEAMRSMQNASETVIQTVLLLSCSNGMPLLPCDDCMRSMIALNPDNIRCEIMMMDRAVPIAEFIDRFRPKANMQASQPYAQAAPAKSVTSITSVSVSASAVSVQIPEATNDADLLRSKVSSLLHAAEDDEDDTDKTQKPEKKKRFGGFFGKK